MDYQEALAKALDYYNRRTTMSRHEHKLVSEALTTDGACPASAAFLLFRDRVKAAMRGLDFIDRDKQSVWVYRDDCPYVLGWIGFGDYRDGGDGTGYGTNVFVVQARTIENKKYADHSNQFCMKMSANVEVALRNAKKYLRQYSPQELAMVNLRGVSDKVTGRADESRAKLRTAMSAVFDVDIYNKTSTLARELQHLLNTEHEFLHPEFRRNLTTYFELKHDADVLRDRTIPMWFVRVYERMGQQSFDVLSIDKPESNYTVEISQDVHRYQSDDLPEDIMGKLSVLNILTDDQYVDGVGYRAGEGMFYVVR
jgi:prophage antirepressor-like protein